MSFPPDPALIARLSHGELSFAVVQDGKVVHECMGRGIAPALSALDRLPELLAGVEVYDTIVGKAAAALFILGGVRAVYAEAGYPMYLTVDVGHMAGQKRFLRPTMDQLREYSGTFGRLWVGTEKAHKLLKKGELVAADTFEKAAPKMYEDPELRPLLPTLWQVKLGLEEKLHVDLGDWRSEADALSDFKTFGIVAKEGRAD